MRKNKNVRASLQRVCLLPASLQPHFGVAIMPTQVTSLHFESNDMTLSKAFLE